MAIERIVWGMEHVGQKAMEIVRENDDIVVKESERENGMGILIWMGKVSEYEGLGSAQVMGKGNGVGVAVGREEVMD